MHENEMGKKFGEKEEKIQPTERRECQHTKKQNQQQSESRVWNVELLNWKPLGPITPMQCSFKFGTYFLA